MKTARSNARTAILLCAALFIFGALLNIGVFGRSELTENASSAADLAGLIAGAVAIAFFVRARSASPQKTQREL